MRALFIKSENGVSPTIYMDTIMEQMQETGKDDVDTAAKVVIDMVRNNNFAKNVTAQEVENRFKNREYLAENLFVCLQAKGDEPITKREFPDYPGLEAYIRLRMNLGEAEGTTKIRPSMYGLMPMTEEELWQYAMVNTERDTVISTMWDLLSEFGVPMLPKEFFPPIYVLTNKDKNYGASSCLFKRFLKEIADKYETDQVMILPSSIHEVIVMPYSDGDDIEDRREMVREINATEVAPGERLVDDVFVINV